MKLYLSRFLACLMISISFLNIISLTSFADTRQSVREVASKSDAKEFDLANTDSYLYSVQDYMADSGISPLAENLPKVTSTISFQDMYFILSYYDDTETHRTFSVPFSPNGEFTFPDIPRLMTPSKLEFYFPKSHLPIDGNYKVQVRYGFDGGNFSFSDFYIYSIYSPSNASQVGKVAHSDFSTMYTDLYSTFLFNISRSSFTALSFNIVFSSSSTFYLPRSGQVYLSFSPATIVSGDAVVDSSSRPPLSSQDVQNNISNGVQDISNGVTEINQSITSGVDSINGNLEEIIRTISMQLEAFWNQLYNGIHLPDMQNRNENTQKVVDSLDKNLSAIDNDILDGFDSLESSNHRDTNSIINNQNNNTSNVINNNNENTDKLANGYDNQGMLDENKRLSDKLDEYENLENELLSDTKDNLNNFEFENPFLSFNAVMSDISYILTAIYNGLGSFNIPIAFSMTLTIAMLCIGWYRFKGGT